MKKEISDLMIRETAYFLWEKAGRPDGRGEEFWYQACEQLYTPAVCSKKSCSKKTTTCSKSKSSTKKK